MKAAALEYAALGWRVFPVRPDGRSPRIAKGCHAASCDPALVSQWWDNWPTSNMALACGPDSGVLALDIDAKGSIDGFAALDELQAEFGEIPATVRSTTPSGGAHLLFVHPRGVSPANRVGLKRYAADGSRRVYAGLDVRAAGASICLPPSRKLTGGYSWDREPGSVPLAPVPRWLLALMLSEPPPRLRSPMRSETPDRVARYVHVALGGECQAVATTPPGAGRNQRLFVAAAKLGELVGAGWALQDDVEAALERAATECGLVKEDGLRAVRSTIASGLRRGVQRPREIAA